MRTLADICPSYIYESITQKKLIHGGSFQLQLILDFGIWIADCIKLEFKTQLPQLSLNPKSEI